ncbi:TetR family transcriptional regulator [Leptospira perolatii]|uniref:TetR family transcriptional regulator n=1 Tax=Leptospira perolatii TaxID=2023191 RepID=A0A2M9ZJA5_9LEPT|nr:TetR/AcrR family transcriptional regulator [Leptospira perolatii]PJZ68814.1 TetR family transcriptional regulator [Leptospira perolatii]PJZ72145.1 TetR family transcriptional regulator [Leptospira perolatii]
MGLREEKKAKTKKRISDLATGLFIKKGFANVTVAEIAQKAEVSVPTLFNYFPTKESFVFDEDEEREKSFIDAILHRKKGTSILDALQEHVLKSSAFIPEYLQNYQSFRELIKSTPELSNYERLILMRYEKSLADILQKESSRKLQRTQAEAIAHFLLDAFYRAIDSSNPKATLVSLFKMIREGWNE